MGTVWTNYPLVDDMPALRFPEGNAIYTTSLHPHAAAPGIVQEFAMPQTNPWRFRVSVSENLLGWRYLLAGIRESLSAVFKEHRVQNPFPRGLGYLGEPREIVSEEIDLNTASNTNLTRDYRAEH